MTAPISTKERGLTDDRCLRFHPFEGDRGTDTVRLSDKLVRAAAPHVCLICAEPIAKGEHHRALTEISRDERKVMTFRFCALCCAAMVKALYDYEDNGEELSQRYPLREAGRRALSEGGATE